MFFTIFTKITKFSGVLVFKWVFSTRGQQKPKLPTFGHYSHNSNCNPANIYLLKVVIETLEEGVKYVQS